MNKETEIKLTLTFYAMEILAHRGDPQSVQEELVNKYYDKLISLID